MYAALADRVLHVDDGVTSHLVGRDVQCVAVADAAYVGTADGVYRSLDDGFERVLAPDADLVTALAATPDAVYAGTEPSRVYRSADGETWTPCSDLTALPSSDEWAFPPRPDTHHVRWIQPRPDDPDALYVAVEAGALLRTPDGGDTWVDRTPDGPRDTHTMAVHPAVPDRAYAAAGDGFFVTTDGGDSWTTRERGLAKTYCWSVAVAPDDPDALAVSSARGARQAHTPETADATVSYFEDGWRDWTNGLPDDLLVPSLLAASGAWYALTDHALYRADERGDRWTVAHDWDAPRERPNGLATSRATGGRR